MRHLVLVLNFVLIIAVQTQAIGLYSVVGPGTIRSNFKYNVAVSVHKADQPCTISVSINGPSYNESKMVDVQPMSTQNVEFNVPQLANGDYNLTAVGIKGITFENSTRLNYADYKPLIFIQTDKATYKPGDLVQFRVLFLDPNTRPEDVKQPISILISDGAQNLIKQIKDVKLTKGVYTGEFQLSEQPVLGNWNIDVLVDGESGENKSFEVAKYVLPKFEVSVESAKDVALADGIIKATVRAKYTYGKSVKGKAKVSVKPSYHYYGSSNANLEAEKTIDVDGKGHVEFDILSKLEDSPSSYYIPPLTIFAEVEEELTGNKINASTTVHVHKERFRIRGIDVPNSYMPEKPIIIKVAIQNLDGSPVQDTKTPVQLIIEPPRSYFYRAVIEGAPSKDEKNMVIESHLDENGIATFEFMLPETDRFYTVRCVFLDTSSHLSSLTKYSKTEDVSEPLAINIKTENPRLGKDIAIEVKSNEKIPYFVYTLAARGNIIMMERVEVPDGRNSHIIKITPTFEMVPKANFYIHYIFDNDLRFEETTIKLEKEFENSINISAPLQAKPGEDVKLKIKTDPESFVGLLGVDQSVLLLKSGNDLDKDQIFNSISNYGTSTPWQRGFGRYPGQISGLVTLTNANYPFHDEFPGIIPISMVYYSPVPMSFSLGGGLPGASSFVEREHTEQQLQSPVQPVTRKEFPENWIFSDIENTEADGFTFAKKIPDTITSWVITGFSLNPKTGLALTQNPTKIQVFQPFFISTNLPYSVKRGEVIAIPVIVFNYMDKALDAEITMDNLDGEFEFTEATNEIEDKPSVDVKRMKRVAVPSNSGKSLSFMIRPNKVGLITLKITAVTPLAGDAIHQTLRVDPEGITQYENRAVFVNLNENSEQREEFNMDLPNDTIPDSEYIEFSCVGDIFGPTMKNLDKLVRMPYGCGEQNMVNFVPNILVLRYLNATNKDMPSITAKAKRFLEIGYQRELTYKHDDGSYSAFGKSDKAGSTWLTAYVMRSFHQAATTGYIDIDPKIMSEGLDFLADKQAENGSFPEYGKLFDSAHNNELGLTSFVLLAFLENQEQLPIYQEKVDKSLAFVAENAEKTDDLYSLAIAALVLQQAKHPAGEKILGKLENMAKQEGDRKWWAKEQSKNEGPARFWQPRSKNVEITSYILLALLEKNSAEDTLPIIKWLISQRNSNGGFSSTQDTVMGLQALTKFASMTGSGSGTIDIDFKSTGNVTYNDKINVNPENALVLQTHVLPKSTRQVSFNAKGTGSALVQLSYRFNIADKDKIPSFRVTPTVKENTAPRVLVVEVCAEYVPIEENDVNPNSNMAVMEVTLPSGFTADQSSFDKIKSVENVKRAETKNSDSTVIVYFDSLTKGHVKCVPIEAERTHSVAKQKPAAVSIYDYYDTEKRATEYYEVKTSLCDICEGEDCGEGCAQN